jgi:hypothetical protein
MKLTKVVMAPERIALRSCLQDTIMSLHGLNGIQLQQWQLARPALHIAALPVPGQPAAVLLSQHGGQVLRIATADSAPPAPLLTQDTNILCAL